MKFNLRKLYNSLTRPFNVKRTTFNALFLVIDLAAQAVNLPAGTKPGSEAAFDVVNIDREGNSLVVAARVDLRRVNLQRNREVMITPMMVAGTDTARFESFSVAGRNRFYYEERNGNESPALFKGWGKNQPLPFDYFAATPWQPWMEDATLMVDVQDLGCANCPQGMQEYALAVTDFVPRTFEAEFVYITPEAEAVKIRKIDARAFIDFPVNRTEIYPDYRRNPQELAKIIATIDSIKDDNDITVKSLHIAGTASPEGPYDNNVRLAKGRTESLMNYVQNLYRFPAGFITSSYEPVDWAGLREWLTTEIIGRSYQVKDNATGNTYEVGDKNADTSTLPQEPMGERVNISEIPVSLSTALAILDIVNGALPPVERNNAIRKQYPEEYKWLLENVYPALRHSDYTINFEIKTFTEISEILEVMQTAPQKLSLNELFKAAKSQPEGSELYTEAMELAVRMFPDDEVANLNAGTNAMKIGDMKGAAKYLDKAGDTPEAGYARALYTLLNGDQERAMQMFDELRTAQNLMVATAAARALQQLQDIETASKVHFRNL